jgi:hypothetical protein
MRLILESLKSLVLASSFCDGQLLYYKILHIVTILGKSGHNEDGYIKLQKSFFSWLFCGYL